MPFLIVVAVCTILNGDYFSVCYQGQENVNVLSISSDVINVNGCGTGLCSIVPNYIPIARITTCGTSVGLVVE